MAGAASREVAGRVAANGLVHPLPPAVASLGCYPENVLTQRCRPGHDQGLTRRRAGTGITHHPEVVGFYSCAFAMAPNARLRHSSSLIVSAIDDHP